LVKPMMERRVARGTSRSDMINPIIEKKDEWVSGMCPVVVLGPSQLITLSIQQNLTANDMISHATVFIGAGSETTAGVLTGVTSFLLEAPEKLERLKKEVRSAFQTPAEISVDAINSRAPYLAACIDEALRLYPQTGSPSLRITGDEGNVICGIPVPPKVVQTQGQVGQAIRSTYLADILWI
jgi:cytochrome P450